MDLLDETVALLAGRLQLDRPLVFLDLEATGVNPDEDRIVQIGALKVKPGGAFTTYCSLVNPEGRPIHPEATAVHGITDADVAEAPTFRVLAPNLADALAGCDLAAYNGRRFDVRMLVAEFGRAKITWGPDAPGWACHVVDPYQLWMRREPRNLAAYIERWAGIRRGEDEGHRADQDVVGLVLGLTGQLMASPDLPGTVAALSEACTDPTWVDPDGKIRWRDGRPVLGFGKQQGTPLDQVPRDYFSWMLRSDFSPAVKQIVRNCLQGKFPTPPQEGMAE